MKKTSAFDALIIGGSYAGLSAAMALGRTLRKVLIIDSGEPCNKPTPHSHNFLTQDGKTPLEILTLAKEQLRPYGTVHFHQGLTNRIEGTSGAVTVRTASEEALRAKYLIMATSMRDILPEIGGIGACWGKTAIHCPYWHGYELRGQATGIWAEPAK